ncbi:MAG: cytochrome c family protein [Candidatus Latescibacterota bacterium]
MQRTATLLLMGLAAGAMALPGQARAQEQPKPDHKYVGVEACGVCHKSERKGNQLGQWQASKHAQAYAVLATDAAKQAGAKLGVTNPQESDKCLRCHVTAAGLPATAVAAPKPGKKGLVKEDGVGCESCHGPGSDYMAATVMRTRETAVANGMVVPNEQTCTKCHNQESPTFKGFTYQEAFDKIKHPNPLRQSGGAGGTGG